jgi:hypothetical protein
VFRDPLSIPARPDAVAMTAPTFPRRADAAVWPTGLARFADGVLDLVGHDLRVPARDVVDLAIVPALGARLQLQLTYRKGFDTIQRRFWVATRDHDDLHRLVLAVRGALSARA